MNTLQGTTTLRLAVAADIPALQKLIDRSVRGLSRGYYDADQIDSGIRYVFGVDSQLIADATYFVVEHDGEPVACGGWSRRRSLFGGDQMRDGRDAMLDPRHDAARIRAFFVHPEWARRGLARRVFEACEAAARAAGFRQLELLATMPGVPLYTALGFVPHERIDVPLPDGIELPCVRMSRPVAGTAGGDSSEGRANER